MKFPIYQIDAFTNRVFRGNPAAVVVLDQWLDDQTLQAIAAENNLAEAAFVARDLMVVLESETQVREFSPDHSAIQSLDAFARIITARGDEVDFVSRFFVPGAGVPEDPVTGSAHCTLIPYWASRLGKTRLVARQLSSRGGQLECELQGDRVLIGGGAVEYMRGGIFIGSNYNR